MTRGTPNAHVLRARLTRTNSSLRAVMDHAAQRVIRTCHRHNLRGLNRGAAAHESAASLRVRASVRRAQTLRRGQDSASHRTPAATRRSVRAASPAGPPSAGCSCIESAPSGRGVALQMPLDACPGAGARSAAVRAVGPRGRVRTPGTEKASAHPTASAIAASLRRRGAIFSPHKEGVAK